VRALEVLSQYINKKVQRQYAHDPHFFTELSTPSKEKPVNAFAFDAILEVGFLHRILSKIEKYKDLDFALEPHLLATLKRRGKSPHDYFSCLDDSAREMWIEEARESMKKADQAATTHNNKEIPLSYKLPDLIKCKPEEWEKLMHELDIRYSEKENKYIWPEHYTGWEARYLIDTLLRKNVINSKKTQHYGKTFLELFLPENQNWRDCEYMEHTLTRSENQPESKLKSQSPSTKNKINRIDNAIKNIFPSEKNIPIQRKLIDFSH